MKQKIILSDTKCWQILKKELGTKYENDFIHGIPHVQRVYSNSGLFNRENIKVKKDILTALKYAVIFHDIGRAKETKDKRHPAVSAEILKRLFKKELGCLENKDWIIFAVENHNKSLPETSQDEEYKCYSLLALFDHMDAMGKFGIIRALIDLYCKKIPFLPTSKKDSEKMKEYLNNPERMSKIEQTRMRNSSILEHITSNYCAALNDIIPRVEIILPTALKKEIKKRLKLMKDFILIN